MKNFIKTLNGQKMKKFKIIVILLLAVLFIELIILGVKLIDNRKNSTYYSVANSMIKQDDIYLVAGGSDSKHSKKLKYTSPGYIKPYIWVYDKNLKIVKEVSLSFGFSGSYNDIAILDDGYIAVGYIEANESQNKSSISEGTIVKYDKDLNVVWRKNLNILGDTKFNSVKISDDGSIYVAGSSIYESDVIGNHSTGGAIIVKYSKTGEKEMVINYGGPKSGEFKDIVLTEDGIVAVGSTTNGTGIIMKYNYDGEELWHNYYGYTDSEGLTSITLYENKYIVTGSKLEEKNKTDSYSAAILIFDSNGQLVKEEEYKKSKISKFTDSVVIADKIYVSALYGKKKENVLDNSSVIVVYSLSLEKEDEKDYHYNKTFSVRSLFNDGNELYMAGFTNSKINFMRTNGLDYYQFIIKNTK